MEGKEITTITDQKQDAGIHQFQFLANGFTGRQGVYFVKMITDDKIVIKHIIKN
jgi:hypothetical protein